MKKKHGWILQAKNGKFVRDNSAESETLSLAELFATRDRARKTCNQIKTDVVRKVELTRTGKAKRVIPGR